MVSISVLSQPDNSFTETHDSCGTKTTKHHLFSHISFEKYTIYSHFNDCCLKAVTLLSSLLLFWISICCFFLSCRLQTYLGEEIFILYSEWCWGHWVFVGSRLYHDAVLSEAYITSCPLEMLSVSYGVHVFISLPTLKHSCCSSVLNKLVC